MGRGVRGYGCSELRGGHLPHLSGTERTDINSKKKAVSTDRPFNTGVYLKRCIEAGIHISDLDFFEVGEVLDILIEYSNDHADYNVLADQDYIDNF